MSLGAAVEGEPPATPAAQPAPARPSLQVVAPDATPEPAPGRDTSELRTEAGHASASPTNAPGRDTVRAQHRPHDKHGGGLLALAIGAAGVVYGDIGTSPLYTWNEIRNHGALLGTADILGVVSLVFWTLTIVVMVKYVTFVLRADNEGEGGTFALMGLAQRVHGRAIPAVSTALIFAACLLYGEGLITPAISVLSAVEGLAVVSPALHGLIVPITLVLLTGLFAVQYLGTDRVGRAFGGIMVTWFLVIGGLGAAQIVQHPEVLQGLSPVWAGRFLFEHGVHGSLVVLGSVVLCITGGEALYADLGHFGARAIRLAWAGLVYPALLLNYFGQGAKLLSGEPIPGNNVFFSLVPEGFVLPVVLLATMAAIIASQALITGAFSLTRAAINLGLLPRVLVVHTNDAVEGQIYMPAINWMLWAGCCALVLQFHTSAGLAAAYGLAVMGVMTTTSITMLIVSRHLWGWSGWKSTLVFGSFLIVDLAFLSANALKLLAGAWLPLVLGAVLFYVMSSWRSGRQLLAQAYKRVERLNMHDFLVLKARSTQLPRAMVFLSQETVKSEHDGVPILLLKFLDRYGSLPKHLTLFSVVPEVDVPFWQGPRFELSSFREHVTSVRMHVGYMETPDVRAALQTLKNQRQIRLHATRWTIVMGKEEVFVPGGTLRWRLQFLIFGMLMQIGSQANVWFGLGQDTGLSREVIPVTVGADGRMNVVLRRFDPGIGADWPSRASLPPGDHRGGGQADHAGEA